MGALRNHDYKKENVIAVIQDYKNGLFENVKKSMALHLLQFKKVLDRLAATKNINYDKTNFSDDPRRLKEEHERILNQKKTLTSFMFAYSATEKAVFFFKKKKTFRFIALYLTCDA